MTGQGLYGIDGEYMYNEFFLLYDISVSNTLAFNSNIATENGDCLVSIDEPTTRPAGNGWNDMFEK